MTFAKLRGGKEGGEKGKNCLMPHLDKERCSKGQGREFVVGHDLTHMKKGRGGKQRDPDKFSGY